MPEFLGRNFDIVRNRHHFQKFLNLLEGIADIGQFAAAEHQIDFNLIAFL